MSDKITPRHLEREAAVYVRQSTLYQVRHHQESQRRQYALADRARALGFREVVVIDDDLGRSGTGTVERKGFARLLEAVCSGRVGAVLALEASRLARNNRDWHHLIDLCALTEALVIDHDGVYDPRRLNDRLLLGLKGTMSEFELGLLRQRAQEALQQMIGRGEVLTEVPVGYERTEENRCEMTPDRQVQEAIRGVFGKFEELGSARQVLLWYRQERIPLPSRSREAQSGVLWRLPGYPRIISLLRNPIYAGAFVHGRTTTRTRVVDGRARKSSGHAVPRKDWAVVLRDHHPGYITWEQYLRNQDRLRSNRAMRGLMTPGAAKHGGALLAGLLRCGRCGRKLHVAYGGATGNVPRYHCKGGQINHGVEWCISFGGLRVDDAVVHAILDALQPLGVQAALDAWDELAKHEDEKHRALRLALEKARYEAGRVQRQYDLADPENRLVSSELESRWEAALAEVKQIEARLSEAESGKPGPTEAERQRLLELGADLEKLWAHPSAPRTLKKRILRTVLEEIVADVQENPPRTELRLHWKGGVHTLLVVPRNARGQHGNTTDHEVLDLVRELAKVCEDSEIARILNRLGLRTGAGNSWTEARVRSLRSYREIPGCAPREERTWCTLADAAAELGVSATVVRRLLQEGVLEGQQVVTHAPWVIARESLRTKAVQSAVRAVREGRRVPRTPPGQTEIPGISAT
jgi:DNA invertase Pin-like site-specific DNA recombinase